MTEMSPESVAGASNYYIPVYSSYNKTYPPLILWFLDTKRERESQTSATTRCLRLQDARQTLLLVGDAKSY